MYLWHEPVLRLITIAVFVFVLGMGMGMVADAALAEGFAAGSLGFGLLIACWGTGSVLGTGVGRWMTARTEPVWVFTGSVGVMVAAFAVGFAPVFPLVLIALLFMGICDGLTIVAENGIMQRRTPDAVRSRVMAAFEAVLSLGLVVSYLMASRVLNALHYHAQPVYRIAGVFALVSSLILLPLLGLRRGSSEVEPFELTDGSVDVEAP